MTVLERTDLQMTNNPRQARRIGSNLLWGQIGRVIEIGLSLVFSILVVRALGPQDYATYSVVWSIIGVAALVASFGYGETLSRYLPELHVGSGRSATLVRRLLSERALVSLVVALGVWAGSTPIAIWTRTPALRSLIGLVAALIVAQGIWELLAGYYNASLRMRDHAVVRFVSQLVSLGLALGLFLGVGVSVWVPLIAMLASYLFSSLLYILGARQVFQTLGQAIALSPMRRFGGYVWLTNLATFGLASQIDVLLIATLLTDTTQVSYYTVAVLLVSRLYVILTGWSVVLMPAAVEAHARDGRAGLARSFNIYMKINLVALVPPFMFVAALAKPLITTLFDAAFAPAALLLTVFAFFSLASVLAGANVCQPLLYVADRQRILLGLRIAAGIMNIILDLLLIPPMGAAGAVIGTSISNLTTHIIEFILLRQIIPMTYPSAIAAKLLVASALATTPALFLSGNGWTTLLISGFLFVVIFLITGYLIRPLTKADYAVLANSVPRLSSILRWFTVV